MAKKSRFMGYVNHMQAATGKVAVSAVTDNSVRSKIALMKERSREINSKTEINKKEDK